MVGFITIFMFTVWSTFHIKDKKMVNAGSFDVIHMRKICLSSCFLCLSVKVEDIENSNQRLLQYFLYMVIILMQCLKIIMD